MENINKSTNNVDIDAMCKRMEALCSQDLDMEFLHTFFFSKLVSRLYRVRLDQFENGHKYIVEGTPYIECNYVTDAIDAIREYNNLMMQNHLTHYYIMDIKLMKKLALQDTFKNVSEAAKDYNG